MTASPAVTANPPLFLNFHDVTELPMSNHLATAIDLARRFLRWWIAELGACLPVLLRKRLRSSDRLVLAIQSDDAVLFHDAAGTQRELGCVGLAERASRIEALLDPGLRQRLARGTLQVCVRLPSDRALRTHVSLPLAAEADLRQALLFQLDRRTPFPVDTVHFAHRVVDRNETTRQLDVELTLVLRRVVSEAVAVAKTLGCTPSAVEVAAETPSGAASGNLLPDEDRPRRRPVTLIAQAAAAVLALVAVAALYQPIYAAHRTADELRQRMQAEKDAAERVRLIKDEVAKLTDAERFLIGAKQATPTATELLYELTRVLPDDTWLQQLTVAAGDIRITGLSRSSSALIQGLGQSGMFLVPQFHSAVMQDQSTGKERFEIETRIGKRPMS